MAANPFKLDPKPCRSRVQRIVSVVRIDVGDERIVFREMAKGVERGGKMGAEIKRPGHFCC